MSVRMTLLLDRDDAGRNIWQLDEPYSYVLGTGCLVTVPAGFRTNFGTVPRVFWRLISPAEMREAALIHDYLSNEHQGCQPSEIPKSGYSRWIADAVLYEVLADMDIAGPSRRWLVFRAVRAWAIWKGLK